MGSCALKAPLVATDSPAFRVLFKLVRDEEQAKERARRTASARAIAETVKQPWPRCSDERIDPAAAWAPYFTDLDVVAWLEAGVYTAAAAIRLERAGIGPRQVARQYEPDVTLGLAFTRGEMSVEQLLREVAR